MDRQASRRQVLTSITGIITVGSLAGCSSSGTESDQSGGDSTDGATVTATKTDGSTDSSPDGPASPVVQHYEALDQNDYEAANGAIHSESERKPLADAVMDRARQMNYAIDSIETDTDGEYPVVGVTVIETNSDSGDTNTLNLRIQVRRDDGDWKMFKILE